MWRPCSCPPTSAEDGDRPPHLDLRSARPHGAHTSLLCPAPAPAGAGESGISGRQCEGGHALGEVLLAVVDGFLVGHGNVDVAVAGGAHVVATNPQRLWPSRSS